MVRDRRRTAACAGAPDPENEACALLARYRQRRTVDALSAQNVHVIEFGKLLGCERFGRPKDHVPRVVNHNVQSAMLGKQT